MLKKTMLLAVLALFAVLLMGAAPPQVMLYQFGDGLNDYLAAADGESTYPVLIALDLAQGRDITRPDALELNKNAALLAGCGTQQEMLARVPYTLRQGVQDALGRLRYLQDVVENKRFPFLRSVSAPYRNDWGQDRLFGGARSHEGIDLMADWGVPVYAVGDGVIEKAGWNTLGGWRIGVRGDSDGVYYYGFHVPSPAYSEYLVLYDIEFVDAAGVNDIAVDPATATPTEVYDIQGRRLSAPARGVNIVRFSDGSAAKILIP